MFLSEDPRRSTVLEIFKPAPSCTNIHVTVKVKATKSQSSYTRLITSNDLNVSVDSIAITLQNYITDLDKCNFYWTEKHKSFICTEIYVGCKRKFAIQPETQKFVWVDCLNLCFANKANGRDELHRSPSQLGQFLYSAGYSLQAPSIMALPWAIKLGIN